MPINSMHRLFFRLFRHPFSLAFNNSTLNVKIVPKALQTKQIEAGIFEKKEQNRWQKADDNARMSPIDKPEIYNVSYSA